MKKRVLFIDRDGTLIVEPPVTFQVDNLSQLELLPGVIRSLYFVRERLDFELVIVTNQDGLGTEAYPQANFDAVQGKMIELFKNEGVAFDNVLIDTSFEHENKPTRKPNTGLLTAYMSEEYDLANSYVIGDRLTDMMLAKNLGCKGILISQEAKPSEAYKVFDSWDKIAEYLFAGERFAEVHRATKETKIDIELQIDGSGATDIDTGLHFFNHMLEQIGKHSGSDLKIKVVGDLNVDEHHTIEDTAIALGEAIYKALGSKRGIERYGFSLPMDDCCSEVLIDFGGRPWLVFEVDFTREYIGDFPTEMALHFFKSLSDAARMNLQVRASGSNEHHKMEAIFKAFARAMKMAVKRNVHQYELPTTKGAL